MKLRGEAITLTVNYTWLGQGCNADSQLHMVGKGAERQFL